MLRRWRRADRFADPDTDRPRDRDTDADAHTHAYATTDDRGAGRTCPTDCNALAHARRCGRRPIGDLTLQSDGVGFVRPAARERDARPRLRLDRRRLDRDAPADQHRAAADAAAAAIATLPADGLRVRRVRATSGRTSASSMGDAPDTEEIVVAREGVWIYLSTSNRNGRAFLSDIAHADLGLTGDRTSTRRPIQRAGPRSCLDSEHVRLRSRIAPRRRRRGQDGVRARARRSACAPSATCSRTTRAATRAAAS